MTVFYVILAVLAVGGILYVLSLRGRRDSPGMAQLRGWSYAHRGLHDERFPENSMDAFRAALENGYGIELDVHLLSDGSLAVLHDSSLRRMTGRDGLVEDLTEAQLPDYRLADSACSIPTFRQVLDLYQGKAPMIVELKTAKGNYAALCDRVMEELRDYPGPYCLESFDPFAVRYLRKRYPQVVRGQLCCNFLHDPACPFPWFVRFLATTQMYNFLTKPDFTAFRFGDRKNLATFLIRKLWGVRGVTWTLQNKQDYDTALREGWLPIFENFNP